MFETNNEEKKLFQNPPRTNTGLVVDFILFPVDPKDVKTNSWAILKSSASFQCRRPCSSIDKDKKIICKAKELTLQTESCQDLKLKDGCWRPRAHAGCDIYVQREGVVVRAVADGVVVDITPKFIEGQDGSLLQAVLVAHKFAGTGVLASSECCLRYCEIAINESLAIGSKVNVGDPLGVIKCVKGVEQPMLHLEVYSVGVGSVGSSGIDKSGVCKSYCRSASPFDPTAMLNYNYSKATYLEKNFNQNKLLGFSYDKNRVNLVER